MIAIIMLWRCISTSVTPADNRSINTYRIIHVYTEPSKHKQIIAKHLDAEIAIIQHSRITSLWPSIHMFISQ